MWPLVVGPLAVVGLLGAACTPDIGEDPPPPDAIVAVFDPGAAVPVVPTPNDLAKDPATGKIVVTSNDATSAAQREFNSDYLTGLDGFPFESTAEVLVTGELDPASVTADTVVVLDLTASGAPVMVTPRYDAEKKAVSVAPPAGGWLRAHKYAVALIGGASKKGVRGAKGENVIGSPAWVLVSGKFPLFECEPDNPEECAPAVDIIPSDKFDPEEKFKDQVAKAKKLDQLRNGYAPLLETIAKAKGVDKQDIPVMWTFSIVDAGEVTFDPANRILPFPNDAVRTGPNGTVSLPHPTTGMPLSADECGKALSDPAGDRQVQLACGLNTLDGFSTLVAPVSENSPTLGALQQAKLDGATLGAKSVGLIVVKSGLPEDTATKPRFTPCLNCLSSAAATEALPQQLQWKLEAPLDEKTTYLAYLTNDAKDDKGKPIVAPPAFAFLRSKAPLLEDGKSTVSTLSTLQATALEPLRAALAPALDALEAAGVPRRTLALAFPFTTQSEASILEQLRVYSEQLPGLPAGPTFVRDATAPLKGAATAAGIPVDDIGKLYAGAFLTPVAVTGPAARSIPRSRRWRASTSRCRSRPRLHRRAGIRSPSSGTASRAHVAIFSPSRTASPRPARWPSRATCSFTAIAPRARDRRPPPSRSPTTRRATIRRTTSATARRSSVCVSIATPPRATPVRRARRAMRSAWASARAAARSISSARTEISSATRRGDPRSAAGTCSASPTSSPRETTSASRSSTSGSWCA